MNKAKTKTHSTQKSVRANSDQAGERGQHNDLWEQCQSPLQDISSPPDPQSQSGKSPTNEPSCYMAV